MSSAVEHGSASAAAAAPTRVDVLVLGASFCGLEFVHRLRRRGGGKLTVAVVDRQASHPYLPLVHERVVGRLAAAGTIAASRRWFAGYQASFVEGEIVAFEPAAHRVTLADGRTLAGRFVLVALGSQVCAPELPGRERFLAIKSARQIDDAERALRELGENRASGEGRPRIVVVGGGLAGVELAGELALARRAGERASSGADVTLVHAGPRLLEGLGPRAARLALGRLRALGVDVRLETRLQALTEDGAAVVTHGGEVQELACRVAFWAGGVRPASILERLGLPRTASGWLAVAPTLQCFGDADGGDPELFAAGDAVRIQSGAGEWRTMQRAIEAIWQADVVARNVLRLVAEAPGYARVGVPPLHPHRPREDFFHGVSVGTSSLVVRGRWAVDLGAVGVWFRRWLMARYFARYEPAQSRHDPSRAG